MAQYYVILVFLLLSVVFAWFLVRRDKGEKEPVGALWAAFAFGMSGLLIAAALEFFLLPDITNPYLETDTKFWVAMAIGLIEETAKVALLVVFLRRKRYFNEHTDGVIYFALAGLGFGLPENILYTYQYGAETGLVRILMTPIFHAAITGLVGYALARVKIGRRPAWYFWNMLLAAIVLHGLYDFGLFSGNAFLILMSVMITLGLSVGLFLLYMHARQLDEEQGLSVVGNNQFCRSCGTPNPERKLYCAHCGRRA